MTVGARGALGAGATVWFTGLPAAGKSTLARAVADRLLEHGCAATVLDADAVREGLNADLGFSAAARIENVRRLGEVAGLMAASGLVVLVAAISPYRTGRELVRAIHRRHGVAYSEVFVDTPLAVCQRRDPKGLYARARQGSLLGLTGVDDPYEPPLAAEVHLTEGRVEFHVEAVVAHLRRAPGRHRCG